MRLETADVMEMLGISRHRWSHVAQGPFAAAVPPPAREGRPRFFSRDDVVALYVLDVLTRLGVRLSKAALLGADVRARLRDDPNDRLHSLWITCGPDGAARHVADGEPPATEARIELPIWQIRAEIERAMAERLGVGGRA